MAPNRYPVIDWSGDRDATATRIGVVVAAVMVLAILRLFLSIRAWAQALAETYFAPSAIRSNGRGLMSDLRNTVESCVDELVTDFRESPHAFYRENSVHCHLYHLLTKAGLNSLLRTGAGFAMRQIQKEYPPVSPESGKIRGRFDLSIFDARAIASVDWWTKWKANGTARGVPVPPTVAIEVGLDKGLTQGPEGTEGRLSDVDKELGRLTERKNEVGWGLLLYLYRYATHSKQTMARIVELMRGTINRYQRPNVTLVAVGFDENEEFAPIEHYELSVRDGVIVKDEGTFAERP